MLLSRHLMFVLNETLGRRGSGGGMLLSQKLHVRRVAMLWCFGCGMCFLLGPVSIPRKVNGVIRVPS